MHRPICDKNFDLFPYLRKLPTVKKKLYILWIMIFEQQQKMNCGTRLSRISLFVSGEILTINDILRWPGSITVLSIDKGVRVSWLVSFHISLGMIVNGSFCDTPTQEQMYDDGDYWEVRWPMNAVNGIEGGHRKEARPRSFRKSMCTSCRCSSWEFFAHAVNSYLDRTIPYSLTVGSEGYTFPYATEGRKQSFLFPLAMN